jgi:geranylgeranyl reductase family protein
MERDVIVVGAGPAGAAAAIRVAKQGRDVLLLDRQTFPRDKACGDGIPPGSMAVLSELGLEDEIREAGFYPIHKLLLATPGGYSLNLKFTPKKAGMDFFIAPRVQFDYLLQQQAVKCGAEFCQAQVSAPVLNDGRVIGVRASINGKSKEILGRVVLGADGATSTIARALSPKIKQEDTARIVAVRAYIEDLEILSHTVEFYWYKDILPGYAWIFPLEENRANIGIGMRVDRFRKKKQSLESLLADFLNRPPIKARLREGGRLQNIKSWPLQRTPRGFSTAHC